VVTCGHCDKVLQGFNSEAEQPAVAAGCITLRPASASPRVWCRFAGPGRGDCRHAVGLPTVFSYPETTDEYGIPHGWCEYCWSENRQQRALRVLAERSFELQEANRISGLFQTQLLELNRKHSRLLQTVGDAILYNDLNRLRGLANA
jgi:hypothetical protein